MSINALSQWVYQSGCMAINQTMDVLAVTMLENSSEDGDPFPYDRKDTVNHFAAPLSVGW